MDFRLGIDLGTKSIGWSVLRLDKNANPVAVIKTGVRIFSDSREAKKGTSLAAIRRQARSARRMRDRFVRRRTKLIKTLIEHNFFPKDKKARKALVDKNPYLLRDRATREEITPAEFARAVFHLNQRRGFKSNRKTDGDDKGTSLLKKSIVEVKDKLKSQNYDTAGQWLYERYLSKQTVLARARDKDGFSTAEKTKIKSYDLFIDRQMILDEFNFIWNVQKQYRPDLYNDKAKDAILNCIFYQRPLKPVLPGKCTFFADRPRAPLALPSQQQFRIYQELNNLSFKYDTFGQEHWLDIDQRNKLAMVLESKNLSFNKAIPKLLGISPKAKFNLAGEKKKEIQGNQTSILLSKKDYFGKQWHGFSLSVQDSIVSKILEDITLNDFIVWLKSEHQLSIPFDSAKNIFNAKLKSGYGKLSKHAIDLILPNLKESVQKYSDAVRQAGLDHSDLSFNKEIPGRTQAIQRIIKSTGEVRTYHVFNQLPYYGEFLQRHVGFVDPSAANSNNPEVRFGKIANPTVHVALNQLRTVVNELIKKYGLPAEIVVEVARDLKLGKEAKAEIEKRQKKNQERNKKIREEFFPEIGISPENVSRADIQKYILWQESNSNPANRCCPYSGLQISPKDLVSPQVEVDHIQPWNETLDDSLNNKVLCYVRANRIKGKRTPWQAREDFAAQGWSYEDIQNRVSQFTNPARRKRFDPNFVVDSDQFLKRALTDTQYISRVAREYLSLICPQNTNVVSGVLTAVLRKQFELDTVLGLRGIKNRNDHRHHAVDACVIAITNRSLVQKASKVSQLAETKGVNGLSCLLADLPLPWPSYKDQVKRSVLSLKVSYKPEHDYKGQFLNDTAFGLTKDGKLRQKADERPINNFVSVYEPKHQDRHGFDEYGKPLAYKAYASNSNYCIEIVEDQDGKWKGEVISTFDAYQIVNHHGESRLFHPTLAQSDNPLVMRLRKNDCVSLINDEGMRVLVRLRMFGKSGQIMFDEIHESNADARTRAKTYKPIRKTANTLQKSKAQYVTVSPIGKVNYRPFKR